MARGSNLRLPKLGDIVVNSAKTLGKAVGSYTKARDSLVRKPEFVGQLADVSRWKGGTLNNEDLAQLRAVRNSWVYTGIQLKSLDLASAKRDIYFNPSGEDGAGKQAANHPFLSVLRRPNDYMGGAVLWQYTQWWMDLSSFGMAWFIEPGEDRLPKAIWPLPSNCMDIEFTDDGKDIKAYILKLNGKWFYLDPQYVCHFRYANPFDFFRSLPPLVSAMLSIDIDLAMKTWNGAFFGSDNVMPSAIISLGTGDPTKTIDPADVETVRNELRSEYGAIRRKTVVTNANTMSAALLGWNAKDMDFLSGMQWNKEETLWNLGVPAGMVDKNSTEANATVGNKVFKDNMWGIKNIYADTISTQILARWYNESLEMRFEDDRVMDRQAQLAEAKQAESVQTITEIREKYYHLPPLEPGELTVNQQRAASFAAKQAAANPAPGDPNPDLNKQPGQANPENAQPDKSKTAVSTKSAQDDLESYRRKAQNAFKRGQSAAVKFLSDEITPETLKSISDDLTGAESKEDIEEIFSHWRGVVGANTQKALNLSWRPWSGFEVNLTEAVLRTLNEQFNIISDSLRAQGVAFAERVDQDPQVWSAAERTWRNHVQWLFWDIADKAVKDVAAQIAGQGLSVNFDLSNTAARNWATVFAADEVRLVDDTTKRAVRSAIDEWIAAGRNNNEGIGDLINRIQNVKDDTGTPIFSRARAERIAQSEATSVYAGSTAASLESHGFAKALYKPRAHVNCRCYIQPAIMPDGSKIIVWYTARDEMVCTTDLETPWGTVKGCQSLHRTIVSEGHAGEKWDGNLWNPQNNTSTEVSV